MHREDCSCDFRSHGCREVSQYSAGEPNFPHPHVSVHDPVWGSALHKRVKPIDSLEPAVPAVKQTEQVCGHGANDSPSEKAGWGKGTRPFPETPPTDPFWVAAAQGCCVYTREHERVYRIGKLTEGGPPVIQVFSVVTHVGGGGFV